MTAKVLVELRPMVRLTDRTLAMLRSSAGQCRDCAAILAGLVDGNGLGCPPGPGGRPMTDEAQKRHLREMVGLALSKENVAFVRSRAPGCFYCRRILEAITEDGTLRDWPVDDKTEQGAIPVQSQVCHIMVERGRGVEWDSEGPAAHPGRDA